MAKRNESFSKTDKKISRAEIVEILEQNVALYREEEAFVPYLVELALFLLEFRYDWAEEGGSPAPNHDQPLPQTVARGNRMITMPIKNMAPSVESKCDCPYCGRAIGDKRVCPHCGNITR